MRFNYIHKAFYFDFFFKQNKFLIILRKTFVLLLTVFVVIYGFAFDARYIIRRVTHSVTQSLKIAL